MPVMRYFEVTEVRTIQVTASTVPEAIQVAEAGFNQENVPENINGHIRRGPVITEMHAKEGM